MREKKSDNKGDARNVSQSFLGVGMEKVVSLCKRRGFIFPGSEIYGGLSNSYDYGPLGVELKNNIKQLWWDRFVRRRDDMVGIDAALIMNPKVWEASGHLKNFEETLIECKKCHNRFRADELLGESKWKNAYQQLQTIQPADQGGFIQDQFPACHSCGVLRSWTIPRQFNLMFKTFLGIGEEQTNVAYLRPETAQGMFVNFKNVLDTTRRTLPFGIAQIGKAFRNEITPKNFIYRVREFEQMEIEYFIREEDWETVFEMWRKEILAWFDEIGIDAKKIHEIDVPKEERAHYSKRTIDFEYEYPFGQRELYGLAYRTDFDLKNHEAASGVNLKYKDPETGEEFWPHVIEPTWGVERSVIAALLDAYHEENDRVVLKLKPSIAPYKVAVFPLLANKPELVKLARKIYDDLRKYFMAAWDDRGNIGKRYYSQDEIGTPFCITVDFESLERNDATVRARDTMKQERVPINKLEEYLSKKLSSTMP